MDPDLQIGIFEKALIVAKYKKIYGIEMNEEEVNLLE